jgi:hypothetical protein
MIWGMQIGRTLSSVIRSFVKITFAKNKIKFKKLNWKLEAQNWKLKYKKKKWTENSLREIMKNMKKNDKKKLKTQS